MRITIDIGGSTIHFKTPAFKLSVKDDSNEKLISTLEHDASELDTSSAEVKEALENIQPPQQ